MAILLEREKCIKKCTLCMEICPGDVISVDEENYPLFRIAECWHCAACVEDCPTKALVVKLWYQG